MVLIFVLGFFIEWIEISYIAVPLFLPIFAAAGVDMVWLAMLISVNLQTSFLTPPFGWALFFLRGVAPPEVTTRHIYSGVMPFVGLQIAGHRAGVPLSADRHLAAQGDRLVMMSTPASRPPVPPFTEQSARQKVRGAEDAWNSRDPDRVAAVYTDDTRWRNRAEFPAGRDAVRQFLQRKWARELDYRLIKELWAFGGNRIAVRFAYEWHDDSGHWFRSYGNENWEFEAAWPDAAALRQHQRSADRRERPAVPLAAGPPARRPCRPRRTRPLTWRAWRFLQCPDRRSKSPVRKTRDAH